MFKVLIPYYLVYDNLKTHNINVCVFNYSDQNIKAIDTFMYNGYKLVFIIVWWTQNPLRWFMKNSVFMFHKHFDSL